MNIAAIRNEYTLESMELDQLEASPFVQFDQWMQQAVRAKVNEPTAMGLSTINLEGKPSSRIVLLKGLDHGFVFYTNYDSQKGKELKKNPFAALTFFWPELERQVRVQGKVEKVSEKESDEYFLSRPIGSQIGAWASSQSQVIPDRDYLESREQEMKAKFEHEIIKRPSNWGGYRLIPDTVEFWQGRPNRLHDRIVYHLKSPNIWVKERLAP